jgi:hypothetical protein
MPHEFHPFPVAMCCYAAAWLIFCIGVGLWHEEHK